MASLKVSLQVIGSPGSTRILSRISNANSLRFTSSGDKVENNPHSKTSIFSAGNVNDATLCRTRIS
jgi:hypothetical protein